MSQAVVITKEKWDYLIVLDACRYDYFKKLNHIKGKLMKKISGSSCTREWLKANFVEYYVDIIYISANPYISNIEYQGFRGSKHFFRVECVWDNGWDKETETVHPKEVVNAALKIIKKYPLKRLIIHFLQPHAPYIGETKITRKEIQRFSKSTFKEEGIHTILRLVREGRIPIEKIKNAYKDNLKLVLNEVQFLVENLNGRIIITSDHGESFGEWFTFHHPEGIYIKELLEVPWLIIDKGKRKTEFIRRKRIKNKIKRVITTSLVNSTPYA